MKEFRKSMNRITEILLSKYMMFQGHHNKIQKEWRRYADKVDKRLEDELKKAVKTSFQDFGKDLNVEDKTELPPPFRINAVLGDTKTYLKPLMNQLKVLIESERKMMRVHSIIAKVIGHGSLKSVKTLNKRLRWREQGIVYQHDPRHIDVIVNESRLGRGNSARTPATFDVTEEEKSEPLGPDQHYLCSLPVDRCVTHNQDRAGTTFIVNELCQKVPNLSTRKIVDEFDATIRRQGYNSFKDNARAQERSEQCRRRIEEHIRNTPQGTKGLDRRNEMISEALTEETRIKGQREKESNKTTVAAQEARSAAASATTTVTGPAASPAGENPSEPDANPRRRLLMKSALLTASSSREQVQERSISNGESRMQVQNIKWKIAVKSKSAASTTQAATIWTAG